MCSVQSRHESFSREADRLCVAIEHFAHKLFVFEPQAGNSSVDKFLKMGVRAKQAKQNWGRGERLAKKMAIDTISREISCVMPDRHRGMRVLLY